MKKKRRELHLWHHWKDGSFQIVHVPAGVIVDYHVKEAHAPFSSTLHGQQRVVFDSGYRWVYFTPHGQNHSLIVAFDADGVPQQLYVDICDGHGLDMDGQPFIHDIYLDVLAWISVRADGSWQLDTPEIIDMEELEEALQVGEVTPEQYEMAWAEARQLEKDLQQNTFAPLNIIRAYVNGTRLAPA